MIDWAGRLATRRGMSEQPSELRGALPTATVLRGYVVEAVLGYGGFGVVYRARHEELGHLVAIKEYLPRDLSVRDRGTVLPLSTDWLEVYEDGKRRFLEEAKRIVQFKAEPGVVTCLDFFRANGTAYLVMEYVDGRPLSDLLKGREGSGRPLDEEELLSLVNPLLKTLSRLHEAGVLHRDLKPSNVLVRRRDWQPILIDFGAAKEGVALHSKSVAPYTEGYAALEQVGEGELGRWTDIYGVGAVMWRIVAGGSPPWTPPNPSRVELRAAAVLAGKPDPLPLATELGEGRFSRGLLETVDRCLVIRADERIQSAEELRRRLVGQKEIPPESAPEPLPEARPRRRVIQVGRAVAATFAVTFAALVLGYAVLVEMTKRWGPPKQADAGLPAKTAEDGPVEAPVPILGSFRVETVPFGAVVALLNGGPPYEPGMRLEPGRYQVEVSAPGYATQRESVEHGTADTVWRIDLREHESPAPTPERPSEWTNSMGMRFVRIPAGEFLMGSNSNLAYDNERPVTQVRIQSAFWMGKYEVTQQQWRTVMGTNPSRFENCGPDCPVESVSWDDVQEFVRRLNAEEGRAGYRLPTEAEWEYAARAGTSTDTPAGNLEVHGERNAPLLDGIAWYGGNSGVDYAGASECLGRAEMQYPSSWCGPHSVGQKDPNAFGLHDMLGNVWEWVRDQYGEYPGGSLTDPTGSAEGLGRVLRGCGWYLIAHYCRSSSRMWGDPGYRSYRQGFRLLKQADADSPAKTEKDGPVAAPAPILGSFSVETVPAGAVVALLNGGPPYEPGMRLVPGNYEVEVSAPGYATQTELVEHGTADTVRRIELREHESPAPIPDRPSEPKRDPEPQSGPSRSSEWTNSVGMRFVRIPAGKFPMGSDSNLAFPHERPVTQVQIRSAFWMGKYEVTQQQWRSVMGTNPSRIENCGPDCPVVSVSWYGVQRFIRRLNAMERRARYRLPTEAEWAYAARAGTSTDTPAGNLQIHGMRNAPLLDGIAWYGGNSGVEYGGAWDCLDWGEKQYPSSWCGPHPVGEKEPNAFGLHDMLGNVSEWVRDRYGEYPGGSLTDPTGPAGGSPRVVRGCGWNDFARFCRSSYRIWNDPGIRSSNLGFRLLRTD